MLTTDFEAAEEGITVPYPPLFDQKQLCRDQKLRTLPRMGAKLEEKVLRNIAQYKDRGGVSRCASRTTSRGS